jgi:DNA-binding transcriptional ArsR family regulator
MIYNMDYNINMTGDRKNKKMENKELAKIFKIFANEHRLAILIFLKNKGERPVGDIADNIKASFGITSKYLLYLTKNGILRRRYDGPFVLYSIANDILGPVRLILSKFL